MYDATCRRLGVAVLAVFVVATIPGCGGGDDNAANELVQQQQIEQAREEGARDARQEERIRRLEKQVKTTKTVTQIVEAPASPSSSGARNVPIERPAGAPGWIAQIGSFPNLSDAQAQAARLSGDGLGVNILNSDDFVELRGGYWVVYAGFFSSRSSADAAASSARRAGASDAFARFVTPRST